MANREYSIGERDELLEALQVAFEEYYKDSEKKHLSLNKSKEELKSDFFWQLDADSNKNNVERGFTISRSTLESFFKNRNRSSFNDKNAVKVNALINFYNQHIYDIEKKGPMAKEREVFTKPTQYQNENEAEVLEKGTEETHSTNQPNDEPPKFFIIKWRYLLISLAILCVGLFAFFVIKSYSQKQEKIAKEKIIIESADEKSKSRAILLSDVYKSIADELTVGEKKLSEGLIRKIITLSKSFDPYEYMKDGQIVKYSPQRAELFLRLIQSDLNVNDYRKIFKESDFSFSDFSNMDLSNIDLIRLINGLEGQFGMNSQLLISSTARPNLRSSFFGNCNLSNARLYGNFNNSDFSGAQIENTFFDWSEAKNANFSNGKMILHVEHSDFRYSNFQNNVIYGYFKDSDFRGVNFDGNTFYPFDTADNPYLDVKNPVENAFYNGTGEVFNNTFLSSGKAKFRYRLEMLEIEDNLRSYLGRSFFKEEYKTKEENWIQAIIVPIDLLRTNKGKDTIIVDPRFQFVGKDYSQRIFLEEWKNSYTEINNYIVRTNDNFHPDNFKIERNVRVSLDNSVQTKVDTMYVISSKDSYCIGFNPQSEYYCPDIMLLGEYEPPASFQNCNFFGSIVCTKIMGVSFKGSHFTNVYFNNSELFNIDMRNTTGNFYLDDVTVLDSVNIDQRSMLSDLKQEKNRLLETKFSFFKDSLSLKAYLQKKKKEKNSWSVDIENALNKFESISQMENRLFILQNGKDYYVCDSLYLNRKKLYVQ